MAEDTLVQVRDSAEGEWADLLRTTRSEALATVERRSVPGLDLDGAALRAVDWITREEVPMTTRTATKVAAEKVETTKARSDANGSVPPTDEEATELRKARASGTTLAELRRSYPSLSLATIRKTVDGVTPATKASRTSKAKVETSHVEPVEPDRSSFPAGADGTKAFKEAHKAYEAALETFRSTEPTGDLAKLEAAGLIEKPPTKRQRQAAATKARKDAGEKAAAAAKKPAPKSAPTVPVPDGYRSWTDARLATKVVALKTKEGKTVKQIAEALGLPAIHRSWFLVSKVWRDTADAKGIDRPRLSAEAIASRKEKRDA